MNEVDGDGDDDMRLSSYFKVFVVRCVGGLIVDKIPERLMLSCFEVRVSSFQCGC